MKCEVMEIRFILYTCGVSRAGKCCSHIANWSHEHTNLPLQFPQIEARPCLETHTSNERNEGVFAKVGFFLVWLHEMRYVSGGPAAAIRELEKLVWTQCKWEVQR